MAMKWQKDTAFVQWLLDSQYAQSDGEKVIPYISDGLVLYCYEAWCAAQVQVRSEITATMAGVLHSP